MLIVRRIAYLFCFLTLPCLFFQGCGKREAEPAESGGQEELIYDMAAGEWKSFDQISESGRPWAVTAYMEDIGYVPEEIAALPGAEVRPEHRYTASEGDIYYCLEEYCAETEGKTGYEYYLTSVDTVPLEVNTVKLNISGEAAGAARLLELTDTAEARKASLMAGMDIVDGRCCVFFQRYDGEGYAAVWFDREGNADSVLDLMPAIKQGFDVGERSVIYRTVCDGNGYYYVYADGMAEVAVMDEKGGLLAKMSVSEEPMISISNTCKLPDGRPVFEYTDSDQQTALFCFDGEKRKFLYRGSGVSAVVRGTERTGNLLYLTGRGVMSWNVVKGQCGILYDGAGLRIADCSAIIKNRKQELVLFFADGSGICLYKLEEGADAAQRQVRVVLLNPSHYVEECAAEYSRTHPGTAITVETPAEDGAAAQNRIMSEILGGKGPDMIVLNREQLKIFKEKDALADLGGILPSELTDQIFEGVLAYGVIEGKLYGAAFEAGVSTLYAPKGLCSLGTWTVRDVMDLMERRPEAQRFESIYYSLTADQMLYDMLLRDIGSSGFVDWEQGKCSFDTEEFYALLEFCGKYGEEPDKRNYMTDGERLQEVSDGEALSYAVSGGMISFSRNMAVLGDDFVCVGYPAEGANGSYTACYRCAAVNAGTDNMDAVSDFLRYLLGEKCQKRFGADSCVRRDVLLNCVKDGGRDGEGPVFEIGDGTVIRLAGKEDGSSFLKEYLELMDTGRPVRPDAEIFNIIMEEAAAYFNGDKDAREAAGIIQNRAGLYLSEQK